MAAKARGGEHDVDFGSRLSRTQRVSPPGRRPAHRVLPEPLPSQLPSKSRAHVGEARVRVPVEDLSVGVIPLKSQCPRLRIFPLDFLL